MMTRSGDHNNSNGIARRSKYLSPTGGNMQICIEHASPAAWSERAAVVAGWFGVEKGREGEASFSVELPEIRGGEVWLIVGASGAGKSSVLRGIRGRYPRERWIDLSEMALPEDGGGCVVDCLPELSVEAALGALGRVGLGEVWTYLKRPGELSEGQRWRLRVAMGLLRKLPVDSCQLPVVLACDEFGAVLDRITARVVARTVRRAISGEGNVCGVFATSHEDLVPALEPDVIVWCDFGRVRVSSFHR